MIFFKNAVVLAFVEPPTFPVRQRFYCSGGSLATYISCPRKLSVAFLLVRGWWQCRMGFKHRRAYWSHISNGAWTVGQFFFHFFFMFIGGTKVDDTATSCLVTFHVNALIFLFSPILIHLVGDLMRYQKCEIKSCGGVLAFSFLVPFLGFLSRVYLLWRLPPFEDFPSWTYLVLQAKFFPLKQVSYIVWFSFSSLISSPVSMHISTRWNCGREGFTRWICLFRAPQS